MEIEELESSPLPDELVIAQQAKQATETDPEAKKETEEAPASEPEDTDDENQDAEDGDESEGSEADADEADADDDQDSEEDTDEQPKKSRRAQRRERQKRFARQQAEELRQLREKVAALETGKTDTSQSAESEDAPPKEEDFDDYSEYVAAKAEYNAEKRIRAELAAQKEQDQQTAEENRLNGLLATFEERVEAVRDKFEDYDEVVFDSSLQLRPEVGRVLLEMERGPELAYEIASDPKVQARLSSLSETGVAIELGKMEAALTLPKARKATKAPDPVKPLKGKSSAPEKSVEEMSADEYRAAREAGKIK